jgi:Kef-type K+ transport system membrane component KefB/Trk K+ transport system NAD-binding subunit
MESNEFIPLLIIVLLAFLIPIILTRFKGLGIPVVVGEIVVGILIGRSGLNLIDGHDPILEFLGEFGLVFLMFLAGLEIDFSNLGEIAAGTNRARRREWGPLSLGTLSFLLTLLLATGIGFALANADLVQNPYMMALVLSTTSLGVVVPVLKEKGLSTGRFGQAVLMAALIADFGTMLLITVLVAVLSQGLTFEVLLVGLLFVAFFLLYQFGLFVNRFSAVQRLVEELAHTSSQFRVRAAFTVLMIFVVLSQMLGAEIILGAFLAGAIVALLRPQEDPELAHKLEAIGFGFFIPLFFIRIGLDFNLGALAESPSALQVAPLLIVGAIIVKFVPALLFRLSFSWREALAAGALLSARLSLVIAASAVGLRLGVISEAVNAAILLVAVLTVTASPLVFVRLLPTVPSPQKIPPILIGGGDELGLAVAQRLHAQGEPVVIVDDDLEHITRARQQGLTAYHYNGEEMSSDLSNVFEEANALICTHNDTTYNFALCHLAHTTYGIDNLVANVNDPADLGRFERIGVKLINAAVDRAAFLTLLSRSPATYELLTHGEDHKEIWEVQVTIPAYSERTLREISLPGDVLALAISRDGELLVPHGNTRVELGDRITLLGSQEWIHPVQAMFGHNV